MKRQRNILSKTKEQRSTCKIHLISSSTPMSKGVNPLPTEWQTNKQNTKPTWSRQRPGEEGVYTTKTDRHWEGLEGQFEDHQFGRQPEVSNYRRPTKLLRDPLHKGCRPVPPVTPVTNHHQDKGPHEENQQERPRQTIWNSSSTSKIEENQRPTAPETTKTIVGMWTWTWTRFVPQGDPSRCLER